LIVDVKGWMGQPPNIKMNQVPYNKAPKTSNNTDRRSVLGKMIVSLTTAGSGIFAAQPVFGQPPLNLPVLQEGSDTSSSKTTTTTTTSTTSNKSPTTTPTFDAYFITPDETNVRSKLEKISSEKFIKEIASSTSSSKKGGAVWLGEHHNSIADHDFQATFIQEIYKQRQRHSHSSKSSKKNPANMAIGLEQVQQEFQPVLDAYIDGKISLDRMRFMVQWDKRWMWSFDNYRKIFETAKELNIPLLALNVDSEDLSLVEKKGYPGLPKDRLRKYIKDP
jgi:hypothetical protein